MLIPKTTASNENIYVNNQVIGTVKRYKYLGVIINENDCYEEIKTRIEQVKVTVMKRNKQVFCRSNLSLN